MNVRVELDDLLPLDVGEDHEGVHRPLDVVWRVLFGLKKRIFSMIWEISPLLYIVHAIHYIRNMDLLGLNKTKCTFEKVE